MAKNNLPNSAHRPFALSLSKGCSWLDKFSSRIRGATPANGEVIFDLTLNQQKEAACMQCSEVRGSRLIFEPEAV